jgi:glycerate kinase
MTRVLLAPDKFKGSLTAAQVADAVGAGIRSVRPDVLLDQVPVADGGDGTVAAALAAGYEEVAVKASGPMGELVTTSFARSGPCAVVELADVSGLVRLPGGGLAPMEASSRGTGEVIAAAIGAGCSEIVLGIGGSACTDGGAGLVRALGARVLDEHGRELADGGGALAGVARVDVSGLRTGGVSFMVASDVDNPLTGPSGAAAVYGPQKGATPEQVQSLDAALDRWASVVAEVTGHDHRSAPGAGAAGGVGFAAIALLGASLEPGIDLVLELTGFHDRLVGADLVVTGEGALDTQTLRGKAPAGVAAAARAAGVPVIAVCGSNTLSAAVLRDAGIEASYSLIDLEPDLARCLTDGSALLHELGARIAAAHLPVRPQDSQRTP